jgi:cellulose synthase/poly-beta-1,6-N-acetylglucosamine synthase-like glycosyltransferase
MLVAALIGMVLCGMVPVFASLYQYVVLAFSFFATHLEKCGGYLPRVSILIPAWNEGAVIGKTIERLLELDYPRDRLRIYVVDDASTDATPNIAIAKSKLHPDNVFHIRRVAGGEGKAHTLNYGLAMLLRKPWSEAILVMDADVIYSKDSLRKMARHLADPKVGAVTAYIKEGSQSPNYVQRFVTFEYITATGASRRAQNVLGFLACLSGGAQLHSRENLVAIGGAFFHDTLAEDTFTTFNTQLCGRRAIFEPNALVYAEEPDSLLGLWKQRLRWARGNVQITQHFRKLWFNKKKNVGLGSISMGLVWFSIVLMPWLQIATAASLVGLYFLDAEVAWMLFRGFWLLAALTYVFETIASYAVDFESARKSWQEGILFPGLVSLTFIVYALVPWPFHPLCQMLCERIPGIECVGTLFCYVWLALSMLVSWLAMKAESTRLAFLTKPLIYLGGYGPLLCAVTAAAYIKEWQGAARTWDKTEKTGKVA